MSIHERKKTKWELKELHTKVFLDEYVSSKTRQISKFSEQDETNSYAHDKAKSTRKVQDLVILWACCSKSVYKLVTEPSIFSSWT